jgi:hypothetical protein
MKKYSLLLSVFLLASCSSGRFNTDASKHQSLVEESRNDKSIIVSLDTIYKSGVALGTLKTTGNMIQESHTIFTLKGDEVVDVVQSAPKRGNQTYHEYKILDREVGGSAFMPYSMSTMTVVENVLDNDLLTAEGLNKNAAGRFLLRFPDPDNRPKAPDVNRMVDRNRSASFLDRTDERKITQDGRTIGFYDITGGDRDKDGDELQTKVIYYFNRLDPKEKVICAQVTYKRFKPFVATVVTSKDNKTATVSREGINRDVFDLSIDYLIKNLYL